MTVFSLKRWFFTYVPQGTPAYIIHRQSKESILKPLSQGLNTYNPWTDRVIKVKPVYDISRHFQLNTEKCMEVDISLHTKDPRKMCDLVVQNFRSVEDTVRKRVVENSGKIVQDVPAMSASALEVDISNELDKNAGEWGVKVGKVTVIVREHEDHDDSYIVGGANSGYMRMF